MSFITIFLLLSILGRDTWHLPMPSYHGQCSQMDEDFLDIKKVVVSSFFLSNQSAPHDFSKGAL